ncbi:MAG: diaminopimelate decarboxylase [Gammaproteobacteria bacterium]|nr:diaminopimelate decarboxylase [Gammaproteobacteria bacterium]MBT8057687.1 diaminopimelate decarboxylase [Gammaproteobacteria bacterium]NNJ77651.1 diaminopimelate decarboxylase [Xanthomonadales bacterium]
MVIYYFSHVRKGLPVGFEYREGRLHCDGASVEDIAAVHGTPVYCYSADTLRERYGRYQRHFSSNDALVCYAVKANSNQAVIGLLGALGAGADVVSGGEMKRALQAGIPAERIVFSGVAKTEDEMRAALEAGILQFNVESEQELERLNGVAVSLGRRAPVAFRVNPDIDAHTHEKITTGRSINKFGIVSDRVSGVYARAASLPGIRVQGIATHIGSQLTELEPFEKAFRYHAELAERLRAAGHDITVLDVGGGLGIDYRDGSARPPPLSDLAALAHEVLDPLGCRILVEPGRSIVGEAGVLVSRVVYVKTGGSVRFLVLDAGMNDLLRPSLYDAHHEIEPVCESDTGRVTCDVVGPICETGDTFARGIELPRLEAGDLVAIRNAGAYGAVMASTYNTRPLVAEVLVDARRARLVRRRLTVDEQIALDTEASG